MRQYTIIGGAQGVGKSSFLGALRGVRGDLGGIVDMDEVADRLASGRSCTVETTLADQRTAAMAKCARDMGYAVELYYIGLDSVDESLRRIENRADLGGPEIPPDEVRRQYETRYDDLARILPLCGRAVFYDNWNGFSKVAEYRDGAFFPEPGHLPLWVAPLTDYFAQNAPKPRPAEKPHRRLPALVRADRELRRRDKTWNVTAPIQIILLVGVMTVGGALSVLAEKPTESKLEGRDLAKAPPFSLLSLADGSYTRGLETFYADTFPLRDTLVRAAAGITERYGVRADEGRIHTVTDATGAQPVEPVTPGGDKAPAPQTPQTAPAEPDASSSAPDEEPPPAEGEVNFNQQNTVFVYRGEALSLFGAGSNDPADYYASQINSWQETMAGDATIYNLVVPTHIEFINLPEKVRDLSAPQKPNIDYIYSQLSPAVKSVDAWSKLNEHKDEYLYFHTDHHWTGLGAYYAYTAFCERAGFTPVPLDSMEKRTIEDYIGSLYPQTQDSSLLSNPDHVDYWIPNTQTDVVQYHRGSPFYGFASTLLAESANSYSVFLGGDYPLTKISTGLHNGRRLAVVKESFGNAIVPFLVHHYEEIYVVDQRYFELNLPAYLRENGVNEILFINNIFAANTYVRMNELARLRTQVWSPPAPEPEEEEPGPEEEVEESSSSQSSSDGKPHARKRTEPSRSQRKNEFEKVPE